MVARFVPPFAAVVVAITLVVTPQVEAAEFTDLLDAADDLDDGDPDTYNPWDFHIEPSFSFDYTSSRVVREAPCVPDGHPSLDNELVEQNPRLIRDDTGDRCVAPRIVTNREMDYRRMDSTLDLTLRAGLYKDLEFRANIPFVLQSSRELKYDDQVVSSSVDPSDDDIRDHAEDVFEPFADPDTEPRDRPGAYTSALDQYQMHRFMNLDNQYEGYNRSGLADPSIGIHWAPWSDYRDDTKATMLIGMDYTMPIAEQARHNNDAVGKGLHEFSWKVASSKRFDWIEPYFGAEYTLPIPATDSLYGPADNVAGPPGQGQVVTNAPHEGVFTVGTEFIPYEDPEVGARYAIDLRFQFGYVSEGRDYTPLFDHMTAPDNDCNGMTIADVEPQFDADGNLQNPGDVACSWVIQQPSNSSPPTYDLEDAVENNRNEEFAFTDLMTVDDYGTFAGQIGAYLQPTEYFQLRIVGGLRHHQSHLITNARTGRDSDQTDQDTVDMSNEAERNPAYNPAYDNSGDRFRVEGFNIWHVGVTTAIQF